MAHAQRSLRKKIEDAKSRAVTEALVNFNEIHGRDDARLIALLKVDVKAGSSKREESIGEEASSRRPPAVAWKIPFLFSRTPIKPAELSLFHASRSPGDISSGGTTSSLPGNKDAATLLVNSLTRFKWQSPACACALGYCGSKLVAAA
jgi:hypothetical protein